jgi:hypothetical protein
MLVKKSKSGIIQLSLVLFIILFVVVFIIGKKYYLGTKKNAKEIALSASCFELANLIQQDIGSMDKYKGKYIELNGVLLNIVNSGGGTTILFTSGYQTDSSYLVGRKLARKTLLQSANPFSPCDSLIINYGEVYNMQESNIFILFRGELINDGGELSQVNYYKQCEQSSSSSTNYQLENFCIEKIKVRAVLHKIVQAENEFIIELDDIILVSKSKTDKKIVN